MSEEFIKEAKNFKRQIKSCSIMCWTATIFLTYKAPDKIDGWGIITFGAIVFTIIYFNMSKIIISYENKTNPLKQPAVSSSGSKVPKNVKCNCGHTVKDHYKGGW